MPQENQRDREQLYIDQHIPNESKARRKNLTAAWINNKRFIRWSPELYDTLSENVQNLH